MRKIRPDAPQFVKIRSPFPDGWDGWRFTDAGRYLVFDGHYITQERLKGLLWRDRMQLIADGYSSRAKADRGKTRNGIRPRVKVVIVDLDEYRLNGIAAS